MPENSITEHPPYIGRFAPSPTGPLHIGSLVAALASYLDARANNGTWLLRIEDLDPPRESPQATDQILAALDIFGLHWDGQILYQSSRLNDYQEILEHLFNKELAFCCNCTREQIRQNNGVYPGTCKSLKIPLNSKNFAIRCKIDDRIIKFDDLIQGQQQDNLKKTVGDFVIKRKDGLFAYQLAVVADDSFQKINRIIRGYDLLDSTPRQIYLQQILNYETPKYGHFPVIVNEDGQKLSKQNFAPAVSFNNPGQTLFHALQYLKQSPEPNLANEPIQTILQWGIRHWDPQKLSKRSIIEEKSII